MWDQRNVLYAPAHQEELPLTLEARTPWQRCKLWAARHPLASALIALVVVGGIVAVIVGPVVSSQRNGSKEVDQQAAETIDFQMTFQAQNASQLCANFSNASFLSSYAATLQTSVASILAAQPSQIAIQSVQCDSKTYYLNSAGTRRRLQQEPSSSGADNARISTVVTFRGLPLGSDSSSSTTGGTSSSAGSGSAGSAKVLQSQLQSSSLVLQQAVSQALGLPSASVVLVSIVTSPQQSVTVLPPPPSPRPSLPPAPSSQQQAPPESSSQYTDSPPAVPLAKNLASPPPLESDSVPATYLPPFSPPIYGGGQPLPLTSSPPPTSQQQPPVYGDINSRRH